METISALLALCALATGEFPSQRPVTRSFGIFFDLRRNKRLSKQSRCRLYESPPSSLWRHCYVYKKVYILLDINNHSDISFIVLSSHKLWKGSIIESEIHENDLDTSVMRIFTWSKCFWPSAISYNIICNLNFMSFIQLGISVAGIEISLMRLDIPISLLGDICTVIWLILNPFAIRFRDILVSLIELVINVVRITDILNCIYIPLKRITNIFNSKISLIGVAQISSIKRVVSFIQL